MRVVGTMIWIGIVGVAVIIVGAAVAITAWLVRSKALAALVGVGTAATVVFVSTAVVLGSTLPRADDSFSHDQIEADRVMTEQMATMAGPGMDALMSTHGMLERSANAAYLWALERHTVQVDRMVGRVP